MPKNLIRALWLAAVLLLTGALTAGCASFDEQQRKWIFQPQTTGASQRTGNTDGMDDVWIEYTSLATRWAAPSRCSWPAT